MPRHRDFLETAMPPAVDWSTKLTSNEIVMCTAVAAATTATVGIHAHLTAAAPMALTAAAATGTAIYSAKTGKTRSTIAVRAASWLAGGAWTSFHLATAALPTTAGWITGATAAILAAAMNYAASTTDTARAEKGAILAFKRQAARTLDEWEERIKAKVNCPVHCSDMSPWPEEAGYSLAVQLGEGRTWKDLKPHEEAFASSLGLPDGCGVEVAKGPSRDRAVIRVSTKDMITAEVFYVEDFSELSFSEPFTFGFHRDGTEAYLSLLDDCGLLIGETGSGKTNLLNTIIMQLARMPDVLIWAIDVTGAGVALPWIAPWALKEDGRTVQAGAPVIDWVAYSVPEAMLMLRMALQIIAIRKARYQKLMRSKNTDKIPISRDVPAILIVADETAELPPDVQALIDSVMNTGRATRVRSLNCGLRATQDTITAAMKKQAKNRIGMSVTDPEELSYLFSGFQVLDPADAPCPGSGFYTGAVKSTSPRPFKARRIVPDIITAGCVACAERRPTLDKISCEVELHAKYHDRWARALPALFPDDYATGTLADEVQAWLNGLDDSAKAPVAGNEGVGDPTVSEFLDASAQAAGGEGEPQTPTVADIQKMFEQAHAAVDQSSTPESAPTPTAAAPEDTGGELSSVGLEKVLEKTGEPGGGVASSPTLFVPAPPAHRSKSVTPRGKAIQLLWDAGPDGTSATLIHEQLKADGFDTPRTTVQGWLRKWEEEEGKAVRVGKGSHTRYVHIEHAAGRE
ncbi:ATP-binding protein [Streptomyces albidoflavus]|uniref:ATP-binding protein n=1 Tax=Streptomyces albidoflavus TaxID=1886 RepID=UPI00102157C6|nr:DNA translocase FtsK [Streptomyces albidoflavus]